ncbi:ferritin-like domain-containing protein [Hypoxylon rubiginosum]|uniref:Ferritin-like domain-containing protein n=1 Tax=Hypoxylon rubiginosum TaxID=110542 RepID=A0ACC0D1Q6_9PEZI|nr:ferritin-like domain-containing protein [Hypoxylon rubiginosum]
MLRSAGILALAVPHSLAVPFVSQATTTFTSAASVTPSVVSVANMTSHGRYTGPVPTTTGALSTSVLASSIPALAAESFKLQYPADGRLHQAQPAPYTPAGGLGTNGTEPVYRVISDFDYESVALALYQEWIELDLFHWGLSTFSTEQFEAAGLHAEERFLLEFMANQEVGHATALTNMLGARAPVQCSYNYPVSDVQEFIDFSQKLTRWGESGVYGFLNHLDSRETAQILLQSITTEARQQMIFRQFGGLFPMPVWFEVGIPQSWAWTLLAPYISSCPANQTRLIWQNFPPLRILNQANSARINGSYVWNETTSAYANSLSTANISSTAGCLHAINGTSNCAPAITQNRTSPLSYAGRQIFLQWDSPGYRTGPNNSYVTSTSAGTPRFAAFVSQLNVTYAPLRGISGNTAYVFQPNSTTYEGDPAINGTVFIAITDDDIAVTPFNLTQINPHVNALAIYQAG